jgi:RNA polymerase sigma factor FliA
MFDDFQQEELLTSYKRQPTTAVKNRLMGAYYPLVELRVRRAIQVKPLANEHDLTDGNMDGLEDALERYDPSMGATFDNYSRMRMKGATIEIFRKKDFFTEQKRKILRRVHNAQERLRQELGREPYPYEVVEELGERGGTTYDASRRERRFLSIDSLPEQQMTKSDNPLNTASKKEIWELLRTVLPRREYEALAMHYREGIELKDIGRAIGITESGTCLLLKKARKIIKKSEVLKDFEKSY